jgi:hypothetical protein
MAWFVSDGWLKFFKYFLYFFNAASLVRSFPVVFSSNRFYSEQSSFYSAILGIAAGTAEVVYWPICRQPFFVSLFSGCERR